VSEPRYAPVPAQHYQQQPPQAYHAPVQQQQPQMVQVPGMGRPTYIQFMPPPQQPAQYQPQNIGSYYQGAPAQGGFMPPPPGWAPPQQGGYQPPSDDVWG